MHTINNLIILKVGGSVLVDENVRKQFTTDILTLLDLKQKMVIVHGGGPFIEKRFEKLQIPTEKLDGYRITPTPHLKVIEEVLFNEVHRQFTSDLKDKGVPIVSFDTPVKLPVTASPIFRFKRHDLGFVGELKSVDQTAFKRWTDSSLIPVLASMACDETGQVYNINADTMASALAGHLSAKLLIYATDTDGVYKDIKDSKSRIRKMNTGQALDLIENGSLSAGMIPKIESCIDALNTGTQRVIIINGKNKDALLKAFLFSLDEGTHLYQEGERL
ncbi:MULTISPECIES: acetylglutamate kinase [unclassified Fusibacter]|uniref:acetylglutamate kinase n=1 Tax=unclassified Fusibacter TaxID=2624464 RepID=UPI00101016C4|nr:MULTISPECIES: acetylglutamate kinase [unclassified Fusibacter]MCK8059504.1 acetylglutamate kinase [Fusibacter sp. A2]NPE21032.1 acetylglutamate kinase [Fusibacter sp. A1]RXV62306.1 acetylglutamate kinase [Fusibacter sp. A1]